MDNYFEWVYSKVMNDNVNYRFLLMELMSTDFKWVLPNDVNRAVDGMDLRTKYTREEDCHFHTDIPCSVLEMMVALAERIENTIMEQDDGIDRTGNWFWAMIVNLGLADQDDDHFDRDVVQKIINRFMDRKYEKNGEGSLFVINNPRSDFRKVEIWYQMCGYLNEVIDQN